MIDREARADGSDDHDTSKETEKLFSERLRIALKGESVNSLALRCGLRESLVRKYLSGSVPGIDKAAQLATALGVSLDWLAGRDDTPPSATVADEDAVYGYIPLYDAKVTAGNSSWTDGATVLTKLAFTKHWLRRMGITEKQCSAVRIDGDSMEPTLSEGDMVLVDHERRDVAGDNIYVIRLDQHLYAKRLRWIPGGMMEIISDNPLYPPMKVEPTHLSDIDIIGKVIYHGGPV